MVVEWHQGRRQRIRGVVPRIHRGGQFLLLRGLTTVILRDLNVTIVAEQLTRGTPVVYVDFVDYDEVAHHAGGTRLESLKVLEALDQVIDVLERVASDAPRRYHFVVVSDHGQSLGAPFPDLYGQSLGDLCAELTR